MAISVKTIFVPAQFSLHTDDGSESDNLPAAVRLLDAEDKAGSRIWVESPVMASGPRGTAVFQDFLRRNAVPYYGLGGATDPAITHILVGAKLYPVCAK